MSPKSCLSKIRFDQITGECVLWFDFQQVHTSQLTSAFSTELRPGGLSTGPEEVTSRYPNTPTPRRKGRNTTSGNRESSSQLVSVKKGGIC